MTSMDVMTSVFAPGVTFDAKTSKRLSKALGRLFRICNSCATRSCWCWLWIPKTTAITWVNCLIFDSAWFPASVTVQTVEWEQVTSVRASARATTSGKATHVLAASGLGMRNIFHSCPQPINPSADEQTSIHWHVYQFLQSCIHICISTITYKKTHDVHPMYHILEAFTAIFWCRWH